MCFWYLYRRSFVTTATGQSNTNTGSNTAGQTDGWWELGTGSSRWQEQLKNQAINLNKIKCCQLLHCVLLVLLQAQHVTIPVSIQYKYRKQHCWSNSRWRSWNWCSRWQEHCKSRNWSNKY